MIVWSAFLPAVLAVSLVPGASQLLGLRNAVVHGYGPALVGLGCRLAAFAVLIGLVVVGLGAVLARSAVALTIIKWFGVAYLVYLAVSAFRSARRAGPEVWRSPRGRSRPTGTATVGGWRDVGAQEFVVAISNPKALLLFSALLPQFASSGPAVGSQIATLGAAYLVVEASVGSVYVAVGARVGAGGMSVRLRRRIDALSGACFLALAGFLAVENRYRTLSGN